MKQSEMERLSGEALAIVRGARREAYGKPERNFERIAVLWTAYLEASIGVAPFIAPEMVCHMIDLIKLARLIETPDHEDSLRDRLGYTLCNIDLVLEGKTKEVAFEDQQRAAVGLAQ